ncbi:phosphotransferase family protein [Demequina sp. NBRC 110055]|uniref:phosphotransferase family protein n=1 Tax=Demequina sp. NBRC 110055 TaxID=1570344 RepID=UPI000A00BD81|nr:aminoglycoside phosphotransferase family protein [Demequina sp. NBRC 110055]
MESATKNRQSLATLRAVIERAYGAEQVPEGDDFATELSYGWFNALYRLRLRDGSQAVLKIAPPADVPVMTREHGMLRNEIAAMEIVAERSGVPLPRIHHVDLSGDLIDADYFLMEYVDAPCFGIAAEAGEMTEVQVDEGFVHLGELNRELCEIAGPHFGPLNGPGFATWREAATALFEDTLLDGQRAEFAMAWSYDELRETWASHAHVLDEVAEPRFIEVDLWAKNSMIRDGRIVAIIDHERALWGDPLMEAGLTGLDLPAFPDPAPFMRGFGVADLTESQRIRRRLYTLLLAVTMAVEGPYREQETAQRAWAAEQLDVAMDGLGRTR